MKIEDIKHFLTIGMWQTEINQSVKKNRLIGLLQRLYLAVKLYLEQGHVAAATELAFTTILAIVPIVAIIFGIANGFGFGTYIESVFRESFSAQPQVADWLINLTRSYLEHAQTGLFIGIGLVFMLYSVISLIHNIESVFDDIWQVKTARPISRIIVDYTAMMFLMPIGIIVMSGLSIFVFSYVEGLTQYLFVGTLTRFTFHYVVPWLILTVMFVVLYTFMPNAKIKIMKVICPAMLASFLMLCLQAVYIHGQIFLTSYNAIYGSLAALPLFMLWMQVSWHICLFCAELSYANQNLEYYEYLVQTSDVNHNDFLLMSAFMLSLICHRFSEGKKPYTAYELKNLTHIPIRVTVDILAKLCEIKLVSSNRATNSEDVTYTPTRDTDTITVGEMVDLLETLPKNKILFFDIRKHKDFDKQWLNTILKTHKTYLSDLSTIKIKDLKATDL